MIKIRSREARQKRLQRQAEYRIAHRITLDYALYDPVRTDKLFTVQSEKIIITRLKEALEGAVPQHAVNHAYGEVLNHFGP